MPLLPLRGALAAWSVVAAGTASIKAPTKLITGGPHSLSRNPMYIAWHLAYLSAAFISNSLWIAIILVPVLAFTHFGDIRKEERFLEERFGEEYRQYKRRVRRYL